MKTLFFFCLFNAFLSLAFGQNVANNTIPEKVKTKFTTLYPDASKYHWQKDADNFEVDFQLDRTRMSILIDSIGNLLESSISTIVLPENVDVYLKRNYPGEKIKDIKKTIKTKGRVYYSVYISSSCLIFDEEGVITKRKF